MFNLFKNQVDRQRAQKKENVSAAANGMFVNKEERIFLQQ